MKNLPRKILIICLIAVLYAGYNVIMGFTAGDSAGGLLGNPVLSQQVLNQAHFNSLVAQRSSAILNPFQEHSFLSRLELWHQMIRFSVTPVNAILGRGLGTLKTDSLYFTYLAEFGYPGAFGIIAIFAAFIYYGLKLPHLMSPSFSRSLIKGIAVMDIVYFVISITGTHIHYFPGTLYFWFFNGVLMRYALDQRTGILPYGVELSVNSRENG
jgi:cell division protein FtsW (lipid II flippase)